MMPEEFPLIHRSWDQNADTRCDYIKLDAFGINPPEDSSDESVRKWIDKIKDQNR